MSTSMGGLVWGRGVTASCSERRSLGVVEGESSMVMISMLGTASLMTTEEATLGRKGERLLPSLAASRRNPS